MVDFTDNCEPELDRNDNSWPGKAGEISVWYYLASNAAAANCSPSETSELNHQFGYTVSFNANTIIVCIENHKFELV